MLPADPNQREQLDWQLTVLGFCFTVMTIYLATTIYFQERDKERFEKDIKSVFPSIKIKKIRDDEFYIQFLAEAKMAKNDVNIMYLSPTPPGHTNNRERSEYYKSMTSLIRKTNNVRFNRIVRITQANKEWITNLLLQFDGSANVYIAGYKDHETIDNPLALSVQIIDQKQSWLVAVGSHERQGAYRDIYIESNEFGEAIQKYYNRIWSRSDVLMNAGNITAAGRKLFPTKA